MTISVTLTLPESILAKIDKKRGDVNRSKFVRLLENACEFKQEENKDD